METMCMNKFLSHIYILKNFFSLVLYIKMKRRSHIARIEILSIYDVFLSIFKRWSHITKIHDEHF